MARVSPAISSATNEGVRELIHAVGAKLDELTKAGERNDTVELGGVLTQRS